MKYLFAIIIGILIAMMVNVNGIMGIYTNVYFSSFIVHLIATLGTILLVIKNKEPKNFKTNLPFYYYCGGIMGAIIIVLNNVTFQTLGVSITLALVLLGQVATSLTIDTYGLLNMKQVAFNKGKIPGLICMLLGILIMMFV